VAGFWAGIVRIGKPLESAFGTGLGTGSWNKILEAPIRGTLEDD